MGFLLTWKTRVLSCGHVVPPSHSRRSTGGTHGNCAAGTSGHTLRNRRRVSASGTAAPAIRSRTAENLQVALPEFGRPPRRNQAKKDEAPLQRRNGADCRAYPTRAG